MLAMFNYVSFKLAMSEHIKRKPKPSLQIIFNHLQWQKNTSVNNEQQLSPEKQTAPNCPQTTSLSEPPSPEEETVVKEPEIKQNDVRIPPITSRIKQKKSHPRVNAPTTQVEILNEHSVESTIKTSHKPKETSSPPQSVQTKKLARKKLPKNSTKPHTSVNAQTTQEELLTERSAESAMKTLQNSEETSLPAKKLEKQKVINNSTPTRSREKQRHPRISAPMTQENLNQCSLESTINTPQKLREPLPPHSFPTKTPRKQRVLKSSIYISPFFTKAYAFSNHFKCYFYVDDLRFCCTEQFYMYYKAVVFGDTESANQIMEMTEARDMKRVGSYIRLFDTEKWRKISILVMTICNMEKYKQNKDLRRLLFETGDTILVEATSQDLYWGAGIDADSAAIRDKDNWPGKNVLGRILTRIRDVLKSRKEYLHEWEEANRRLTI